MLHDKASIMKPLFLTPVCIILLQLSFILSGTEKNAYINNV